MFNYFPEIVVINAGNFAPNEYLAMVGDIFVHHDLDSVAIFFDQLV